MDWEQIGFMVGAPFGARWGNNYIERGRNKARDILAGIGDPNAEERKRAQMIADAHYGNGLVGQNPETLLLQAKRDWMQADNDAQYLLDNGYAEDSPDVQKFREIQSKAHRNAEFLRGLGKSTGVDLTNVGTGMGLADLKDAVNRGIAPMMYQQYPQLQEQMEKRNTWAGQTARDILNGQIGQGVTPIAPISNQADPQPVNPQPVSGAAPMTPPAAQLGGYAPQGTNLIDFNPNAGFGMQGTANPILPDQNNSLGRAISGADVFKYLQDRGAIPKERTYAEEVEDIAKAFAQQRAAKMDDREIRKYLKESGVPTDVAKFVMAEQKQQMQEQMKKNALAQAAAASSSPQMAYLIAAAAADPNTKLSDISGLINATNPDMKFETIDLGGTKVAMTRDAKGRVQGGAQALPVTLSPKDAAGLQFDYDKLGSEVDRFNAQENRLWKTAQGNWQNRLDVARTNGDYGLIRASLSGKGQGGEKRTAAEAEMDAQYGNQFSNVMELWNKSDDVSREDMSNAVELFTDSVIDGINKGKINGDDKTYFLDKAYLTQLMLAARFGEKEDARKIWGNFSDGYLHDTDNPDYTTLNDIYQWMNSDEPDAAEKAHVQNKLSTPKKEYELFPSVPGREHDLPWNRENTLTYRGYWSRP